MYLKKKLNKYKMMKLEGRIFWLLKEFRLKN